MKRILLLATTALLSACVTTPKPLEGEFVSESPQAIAPEGQRVRWGGDILSVEPEQDQTCLQVLAHDLDSRARPRPGDMSAGRFVACRGGFYDPAVFAEGREITVVGTVAGTQTRRIGEYDYTLPRVRADVVYLWPERLMVDDYYHYGRPYAGWWPYTYYGPPYYPYHYYRRP
jgi:outer membrane lipoprotein